MTPACEQSPTEALIEVLKIGRGGVTVKLAPHQCDLLLGWSSAAQHVGREGIVTVWDATGGYVGCMGIETWQRVVAEGAP